MQQLVIYTKTPFQTGRCIATDCDFDFFSRNLHNGYGDDFGSKRSTLNEPLATVWGILFFIVAPIAHGVGLILGIIGLFRKERKKVTAMFGIILNAGFVALGFLFVILLLGAVAGVR